MNLYRVFGKDGRTPLVGATVTVSDKDGKVISSGVSDEAGIAYLDKVMPRSRKIEIFSQIIRHLRALVYLIAELVMGERPEKL